MFHSPPFDSIVLAEGKMVIWDWLRVMIQIKIILSLTLSYDKLNTVFRVIFNAINLYLMVHCLNRAKENYATILILLLFLHHFKF